MSSDPDVESPAGRFAAAFYLTLSASGKTDMAEGSANSAGPESRKCKPVGSKYSESSDPARNLLATAAISCKEEMTHFANSYHGQPLFHMVLAHSAFGRRAAIGFLVSKAGT